MLRTVLIWLFLIAIAGIPTLVTIFAAILVHMEEIGEEEMAFPDRNAEEAACFRQAKDHKAPAPKPANRDSTR